MFLIRKNCYFLQARFAHQDEVLLGLGTNLKIDPNKMVFRLNKGDTFSINYTAFKKLTENVQDSYRYIEIFAEEVKPPIPRVIGG